MFRNKKKDFFIESVNIWVGSGVFLILHILWFTIWLSFALNLEILIMLVSLEAVILMILLLMASNKKSVRDDQRAEEDLKADLAALRGQEKMMQQIKEIKREIRKLNRRR